MPWKNSSSLLERERFVLEALRARESLRRLSWDYGISRKTAYKWLERYKARGLEGLRDKVRRPACCPWRKPACWKERVVALRKERSYWGAKKLHRILKMQFPRSKRVPSVRTIHRWLGQLGLIKQMVRRARRGPAVPYAGLTQAVAPHQVWTVDFKGWFRTRDGQRQEPLSVREAHRRYLLDLRLLGDQGEESVRRAMTRIFRREGLPQIIRVDNGSPFAGKGALGLSRLSVWWLRLGIRVEFTRRARPGDNAAHEQMHSRYQAEVACKPLSNRKAQQRRTNAWRHDYNHRRPHEALGQRTPGHLYKPSSRPLPWALPTLRYPKTWSTRRVRPHGDIKWKGQLRFVGRAFVGQTLGLKALSSCHWAVHLGPLLIGELHSNDQTGMRPAHRIIHPKHPKV
jgi:putative transposase